MRSVSWLYCAAICGGLAVSFTIRAQENWEFPPIYREVGLVAHHQPIKPPPDDGLPSSSDQFPEPPGARRPWLVDDAATSAPSCATRDEALNAPNCGCEDIQYTCCPPTWLVRAEALIWTRTTSSTQLLGTAPGAALTADDLNSNWAAGPRLTLQRNQLFGTCWDLELVYFGIDGFQARDTLVGAVDLATNPPQFIGGGNATVFTQNSRLYNAEVNLRRQLTDRLTFLHGFRWMQFSDNLNTDLGGLATRNIEVGNQLWGYQIGGDYRIWSNNSRWFLDGVGKAGIFGNSADQRTTTVNFGGVPSIASSGSQVAFVSEGGIYGGYRVTDSLRILGGYSVLWMTGVAEAPAQIAGTNLATGASALAFNSDVFFHGANVGIEWVR